MATIGEARDAVEQRRFVGRQRELELFDRWLGCGPALLKVDGPGGIGKTALLAAFSRAARQGGRPVRRVDGRLVPPKADALLAALGCPTADNPVAEINLAKPVLILDTFEELYPLTPFLQQEFLPLLDDQVKVVMAGRHPLGRAWRSWADQTWSVSLSSLSPVDTARYLELRGITEPRMVEAIWLATVGHPLAVSLAADLASRQEFKELSDDPEWHLSRRNVVESLLEDVPDKHLRALLEAAATVRQFDELTLSAVSGEPDVSATFQELCGMSIVRPAEHGLMLHDDVRRLLTDDLRWRRPDRWRELRTRAQAFYRQRTAAAHPPERSWLVLEQMSFWQDSVVQAAYFLHDEPGAVWVQQPRPPAAALRDVQRAWARSTAGHLDGPPVEELSPQVLDRLIDDPHTEFQLALNRDGIPQAYGFVLPVLAGTVQLLPPQGPLSRLLSTWTAETGCPPEADRAKSQTYFISTVATGVEDFVPAYAALGRACMGLIAERAGCYLALTRDPMYAHVLQSAGFYPVPGAEFEEDGRSSPLVGYVLDVAALGAAHIDCLVQGLRPPRTFRGAALERELEAALVGWHQDLGQSPLAPWAAVKQGGDGPGPDQLRRWVLAAIGRAEESGDTDQRLAVRAVRLGYLTDGLTQDAAASRLAVSRATFYRLRRRGVSLIARSL